MESPDQRELCISLHQPWASLLVHGIKRIEGRSWRSGHRGRLWIHASGTPPHPAVIQELEDFYRQVHAADGGPAPQFPRSYPLGALVGCVDVVDVLTAEEVAAWLGLPAGLKMEVGSEQAFLCERPRVVTPPIRMRGWPKMWGLPPGFARQGEAGLAEPQAGLRPFSWSEFKQPADLKSRILLLPPHPKRDHWKRTYMSPKRNRPSGSRSGPSPYWEQARQAVAIAQE